MHEGDPRRGRGIPPPPLCIPSAGTTRELRRGGSLRSGGAAGGLGPEGDTGYKRGALFREAEAAESGVEGTRELKRAEGTRVLAETVLLTRVR